MAIFDRELAGELRKGARHFPAVILSGPRTPARCSASWPP